MICFPIMHKQTIRKVIKLAYAKDTKYGVMAELMFVTGYRLCDVIKLKKNMIFNGSNYTLFFREKKTGVRRMFKQEELPPNFIDFVKSCVSNDYLFSSQLYRSKGINKHLSASCVKAVFREIFSNIPKLKGARGTHIFRKTYAYNQYKKGDIYRVMRKLGHKNINSTIKYLPPEIFENEK